MKRKDFFAAIGVAALAPSMFVKELESGLVVADNKIIKAPKSKGCDVILPLFNGEFVRLTNCYTRELTLKHEYPPFNKMSNGLTMEYLGPKTNRCEVELYFDEYEHLNGKWRK